jgi:hypothetical protein
MILGSAVAVRQAFLRQHEKSAAPAIGLFSNAALR